MSGYDSRSVVLGVVTALAARGVAAPLSPAATAKAQEAAGRLLWALGVEDSADPLADVVDLEQAICPGGAR